MGNSQSLFFWASEFTQKQILWSPAWKESMWDGAWSFIIHYADFHWIPLCSRVCHPCSVLDLLCPLWLILIPASKCPNHLLGGAVAGRGKGGRQTCLRPFVVSSFAPSCLQRHLEPPVPEGFWGSVRKTSLSSSIFPCRQIEFSFSALLSDTVCLLSVLLGAIVSSPILLPCGFVHFLFLYCNLVGLRIGAGTDRLCLIYLVASRGKCIDEATPDALRAESAGTWSHGWRTFKRRLKSLVGVNRVNRRSDYFWKGE